MDNHTVLLEPLLSKGIVGEVLPYEVGKSLLEFGTLFMEPAGPNNHNKEGPSKRQRSETEQEEVPDNLKYLKRESLSENKEPSAPHNNYRLPSISTLFQLDPDIRSSISNNIHLPCLREALNGPSKQDVIEAEVLDSVTLPPPKKKQRAYKVPSWALKRLRRWFTCDVKGCNKSFSDERDLHYHCRIHHSMEQTPDASSGTHRLPEAPL